MKSLARKRVLLGVARVVYRHSKAGPKDRKPMQESNFRITLHSQPESSIQASSLMFTRKESSQLKHEFWTAFGRYMSPVPSAEGEKINWVNYHTTIKDVFFRMDAGQKSASIFISLEHNNTSTRHLHFDHLLQLKTLLHSVLDEEWSWQRDVVIDNRVVSRVEKTLPGVSIMNRDHWPELISFFKPRIIALDSFWQDAKWGFEGLGFETGE